MDLGLNIIQDFLSKLAIKPHTPTPKLMLLLVLEKIALSKFCVKQFKWNQLIKYVKFVLMKEFLFHSMC